VETYGVGNQQVAGFGSRASHRHEAHPNSNAERDRASNNPVTNRNHNNRWLSAEVLHPQNPKAGHYA
jgi:hypothetical protein